MDVIQNLKATGFIKGSDKPKLPILYATVKMHKTPVSFRYITAGIGSVLQNLSISVSKGLKILLNVASKSKEYRIKDIDSCTFIVDNRDKVVDFMEMSNASTIAKRKCVSTWDFSTLYTKIPHNQLISNVSKFINDVFKSVKDKQYIASPVGNGTLYFTKLLNT